jgi:hypothetical protein
LGLRLLCERNPQLLKPPVNLSAGFCKVCRVVSEIRSVYPSMPNTAKHILGSNPQT